MAASSTVAVCEVMGTKFYPTPKGIRVGSKTAKVQHPNAALADFPGKRQVRKWLSRNGHQRHATASLRPV
jgi:hypothetical protein